MTHEDIQDLVPLFAIDALDPGEEMQVRSHLQACDACADLADLHRETAFALAGLAPPVSPPEALRRAIMAEAASDVRVTPLPAPRRRRWWETPFGAVAAVAAVVVLGFTGWMGRHIDRQNEMLAQARRAFAVVSSPSVQAVALSGKQSGRGATGQVFIQEDSESAAVILTGLADPQDQTYALWLITGGRPASLGDFRPDEAGVAVIHVARPVVRGQTVAVTVEPSEGSKVPRGPVVLST